MSNHIRSEMWVSIGFAGSFFVAFLVTLLASEGMSWEQPSGQYTYRMEEILHSEIKELKKGQSGLEKKWIKWRTCFKQLLEI